LGEEQPAIMINKNATKNENTLLRTGKDDIKMIRLAIAIPSK
jgi:hypothetical protein